MTSPTPLVTDLPAICSRLLVLLVAALDNPPARQYRAVGVPAWDKEQVTLAVSPLIPGVPGFPTTGRFEDTPNGLRTVTIVAEVVRCQPTSDNGAPSADRLDASAAVHIADYQALDRFVRALGFNGKVRDDQLTAAGMKGIAPGMTQTVSPSGGMAAVRLTFSIEM